MAAGLPATCQIFANDLAEAHRAKTRKMPAMNDGYRQLAQALEGLDIGRDVGVIGIVDQRPVINNVARQEEPGSLLEKTDSAGGMAGRVDNFEGAISQSMTSPCSRTRPMVAGFT